MRHPHRLLFASSVLAACVLVSSCGGGGGNNNHPDDWAFTLPSEPAPMVDLLGTFDGLYYVWWDSGTETTDFDQDGALDDVRETLVIVATDRASLCDDLMIAPFEDFVGIDFIRIEATALFIDGNGAIGPGSVLGEMADSEVTLSMIARGDDGVAVVQAYDDAMAILTVDTFDDTTLAGSITGGSIVEAYDGSRMVPATPTMYTADLLQVPHCPGLL